MTKKTTVALVHSAIGSVAPILFDLGKFVAIGVPAIFFWSLLIDGRPQSFTELQNLQDFQNLARFSTVFCLLLWGMRWGFRRESVRSISLKQIKQDTPSSGQDRS